MKKGRTFFQMVVFSALVCFGVSACGGGGGGNNSQVSSRQERINVSVAEGGSSSLILGQKVQLKSSVEGVTWESSKTDVATVDANGLVTSVAVGSASITASKDGYRSGSITIKVDLEKIEVTASANSVVKGQTVTLTANKEGVTWTSSDTNVATVENGVVTGVNFGTATITASKDGFNPGTVDISVTRPAPTATLHFEDADHYSPTGDWAGYNTTYETPIYEKESASDGKCIAHFAEGCKETLSFSSSAEVKAEVTMTMLSRSSYNDLTAVFTIKFNGSPVTFSGAYTGGEAYPIYELSLGEQDLKAKNAVEVDFLGGSPYLDDLNIYAASATTIALIQPEAKEKVVVNETSLAIAEGKTAQITSSMEGLSYRSSNAAVAVVDANGLVRGVGAGEANISVSKDGYETIKVPVTVTANENAFVVGVEEVQGEGVTHRDSQNIQGDHKHFIEKMDVDAVATITFQAQTAGSYTLIMKSRASGGYGSTVKDDLATCMEFSVNGVKLTLSGEVSGFSFNNYYLGEATLAQGDNTITIKCLTAVPQMNTFRFIPNA